MRARSATIATTSSPSPAAVASSTDDTRAGGAGSDRIGVGVWRTTKGGNGTRRAWRPPQEATLIHVEHHYVHRGGWLRAGVLGANDGIVSTASLLLGVAAADSSPSAVLTAGVAGLVGGALSMAAGEYVSVSSQADVERADLAREAAALRDTPREELDELTAIYVAKGLSEALAREVATALSAGDALAVHAREELGLDPEELARPWLAAGVSATSFAIGAAVPLAAMLLAPEGAHLGLTLGVATVALAGLGGWSAWLGGAPVRPAVVRVVLGGGAAMGLTMGIGALFGVAA